MAAVIMEQVAAVSAVVVVLAAAAAAVDFTAAVGVPMLLVGLVVVGGVFSVAVLRVRDIVVLLPVAPDWVEPVILVAVVRQAATLAVAVSAITQIMAPAAILVKQEQMVLSALVVPAVRVAL